MIRSFDHNSPSPEDYAVEFGPSYVGRTASGDDREAFADKITDPKSIELFRLWESKITSSTELPQRSDFEFEELVPFGTCLTITKREKNGRWKTTFCGSEIVQRFGIEFTGKYLDETADATSLDFWLNNFKRSIQIGAPFIEFYNLKLVEKEYLKCADLNMPVISNETAEADTIFSILSFK